MCQMGVSQNQGYIFGDPYNKDFPPFWGLYWGTLMLGSWNVCIGISQAKGPDLKVWKARRLRQLIAMKCARPPLICCDGRSRWWGACILMLSICVSAKLSSRLQQLFIWGRNKTTKTSLSQMASKDHLFVGRLFAEA